jgi:hypothetical protein
MKLSLIFLLFLVLVVGCTTNTVTYSKLQQKAFAKKNGHTPDVLYYCGTKDNYDYFYVEYQASSTAREGQEYRVNVEESPVPNRFAYTQDRTQWQQAGLYTRPLFSNP